MTQDAVLGELDHTPMLWRPTKVNAARKTPYLLSRHDGSAAADARAFRRLFKRIDDGRWQTTGAKSGGVEDERREVARTEVRGLRVGGIRPDQVRIVDGTAEENNGVAKAATLSPVSVQVNTLACTQLRNEDQGLQREALVVGRVLVTRHLFWKSAIGVNLSDSFLVGFNAEAEERVVCGGNPDGGCSEGTPVVVIVIGIARHLGRDIFVRGGVKPGGNSLFLLVSRVESLTRTESVIPAELSVHSTWYQACEDSWRS